MAFGQFMPAAATNRVMAQNLEFEHLFDEEKATGFKDRMHSSLLPKCS